MQIIEFFPFELSKPKLRLLVFLSSLIFIGILLGAVLMHSLDRENANNFVPLFFSGIPSATGEFLDCFSTFLLNMLIFQSIAFLLGLTVFGAVAVSALTISKGVTVGIGVSYFLLADGLSGLGKSALLYVPISTASLILFVIFATYVLSFSERLRKVSFSSDETNLNFFEYLKTFFGFLCMAVVISAIGGGFASVCSLFLSLL